MIVCFEITLHSVNLPSCLYLYIFSLFFSSVKIETTLKKEPYCLRPSDRKHINSSFFSAVSLISPVILWPSSTKWAVGLDAECSQSSIAALSQWCLLGPLLFWFFTSPPLSSLSRGVTAEEAVSSCSYKQEAVTSFSGAAGTRTKDGEQQSAIRCNSKVDEAQGQTTEEGKGGTEEFWLLEANSN